MPSPKVPSAKLLARRAARIQWNHDALDELELGMADGLAELGDVIIADATEHAPDRPPIGVGLVETGKSAVWVRGKKVSGDLDKPKRMKMPLDQVVMVATFTSPIAHFAELGTVTEPARPFLLPAFNRHVPGAAAFVVPAMGKRMKLGRLGSAVARSMGYKVGVKGGLQGMARRKR
jgi:hypothetical protein